MEMGLNYDKVDFFFFFSTYHQGVNFHSHVKVVCLHIDSAGNLTLDYRWENPCLHNIYSGTISLYLSF